RRAAVAAKMADNSMLILFSAEPKIYSNSVSYVYRQENNYVYLTGLKQHTSMLVIRKQGGNVSETLFLRKRNPQYETWNGKMYSNEEASQISGLKTIVPSTEMPAFLEAVRGRSEFASTEGGANIAGGAETVYLLMPRGDNDNNGRREFRQEAEFAKTLGEQKTANGRDIFDPLRLIKSPYEIKIMRHSIAISNEAHMRAMAVAGRTNHEYEVQAEVEYTFRRRGADYWGYPSIVGCGPNATTLHYQLPHDKVTPGQLMLIDVGAEYEHYTADITRTFPVNGKFTKEQAEIYQIVYDAQEAAAAASKPGATFADISAAAARVIEDGLFRLGLVT